jgi:Activator of Hsp90 ATPase homolog 1-like protein
MTDARVQSMTFDSVDPDYSGEMTMVVTFEDRDDGTEVTIAFEGIPPGIRPEDNDAGTRSSLEKLARYPE